MRRFRQAAWCFATCLILVLAISGPTTAAEISADMVALMSDGGKLSLATDPAQGVPQWGLEMYLASSGQELQWGLDVWGRVYRDARWVGLAVGWRSLKESFAVATAQAGYRFALAPDAFLDAGVGLQVRTNGFVGFVPRISFGWKW